MATAAAELTTTTFGPAREVAGVRPSPGPRWVSSLPSGNFSSPGMRGLHPSARRSARRADTVLSEWSGDIRLEPTAGLAGKLVTRTPWPEIAVAALTSRLPSAATLGSSRGLWWESERRGWSGDGARIPTIACDADGGAPMVDKSLIGPWSRELGHDDEPNGSVAVIGGSDSRPREDWMSRGRDPMSGITREIVGHRCAAPRL